MSINSFLNQSISFKLIIVVGGFWLIVAALAFFYFFGGLKEGFQAGLVGLGTALDYKMGEGVKGSWENKKLEKMAPPEMVIVDVNNNVVDDTKILNEREAFKELETNVGGDVPLPEGELVFFDKTKFSPECCPSTYSTGAGCACASPEQMQYLNQRGGNRTLTSGY